MNDNLSLFAKGGATILGQYDWYLDSNVDGKGGDPIVNLSGTQDPAGFFEFGMGLSF